MKAWSENLVWVTILVLRGFSLWYLIPVWFIAWLVFVPFTFPRPISLGAFLAWLDVNGIVFLHSVIFRPLIRTPRRWVRPDEMRGLTLRIRAGDLY